MALDSDLDEEPIQPTMHLYPRHVSEEQMRRYEGYMAEIFRAFGLDLKQIADTLEAMLEPHGVAVYLEAHHLCTEMRGVRAITPITRTTFWRGNYDTTPYLRAEFFTSCSIPGGGHA